jgi:PAS domain S-box-containing protein
MTNADDTEEITTGSEVSRKELEAAHRRLRLETAVHRTTVRALKESEARFRSIAENIPDIIARFDRELRHLYVNRAVEPITGLSQEDYLGKTNRELGMPKDLCDAWDNIIRGTFESGEPYSGAFELESQNGLAECVNNSGTGPSLI